MMLGPKCSHVSNPMTVERSPPKMVRNSPPCVRVAPVMYASVRFAPPRYAWLRSAPFRCALVRFAPHKSAWYRCALVRFALHRFARNRSALLRSALLRSALPRSASARFASVRFAPVRSAPDKSGWSKRIFSRHSFHLTPCFNRLTCSSFAMAASPSQRSVSFFLHPPPLRRHGESLLGEPPQRFGTRRQIGLIPPPLIETREEFLVDPDVDLRILGHW